MKRRQSNENQERLAKPVLFKHREVEDEPAAENNPTTKPSQNGRCAAEQLDDFRSFACRLGADGSKARFEEKLGKIAKMKRGGKADARN